MSESPRFERPIFVFAAPADAGVADALAQHERLVVEEHQPLDREGMLAAVRRASVLVTRSFQRIDDELLRAGSAGALQVVVQASAGLDNVDHDAARAHGVEILAVDPGNATAVAELTLLSLLALFRGIRRHWDATPQGTWPVRDRLEDCEIRGKRLGIVGLGRCGTRVAERARVFGMQVAAVDPYIAAERFSAAEVEHVATLNELLPAVDALTLHCPLTHETRGMIDASALTALRRGAVLVNTARGPIVEGAALVAALDSGQVSAAALDVFEEEPPKPNGLVGHPRLLATPHLGGHTTESHRERGENLLAALRALATRITT